MTISVVITAYNRPEFLSEAIKSVLAQTYKDYELIVIDDCSPTDLSGVVNGFAAPINYHRLEQNGKLSNARNVGVKLATREFVAFLDDDDTWLPNKLERQIATIGDHQACLCGFRIMETGRAVVRDVAEVTQENLVYGNRYCGPTGLLARRDVLLSEIFDTAMRWGEDWDLYVRLAQKMPMGYCREVLFDRRTGDAASMTNLMKKMSKDDAERVAGPLRKHRDWLGERLFKRRLAGAYLSAIGTRKNKPAAIMSAISAAGIAPTLWYLSVKTLKREDGLVADSAWSAARKRA